MSFKPAQCPNCGGALQLPDDRNTVNCMYCGITIIVREAIQAAAVGNVKNWLNIAGTAALSGNYPEAYAFFTRVLEVDADNSDAWLGRAEAAGRMSTIQHFRLLEMITGIEKGLDSAAPGLKDELEKRCARFACSTTSNYYDSMKAEITAHFNEMSGWTEYINQLQKTIQVLEKAHLVFPRSEMVIGLLIRILLDNLDHRGVTYRNNKTRQMNYWALPRDQKQWLQGRYEYYMRELLALNPHAAVLTRPRSGLLETLRTIPTPGWIAIGAVGLLLIVSAITQNDAGRSTLTNSNPSDVRQVASPAGETADFVQAGSRIWTGVKLYHGPSKTYVGVVLGGNENYVDPLTGQKFRGVKIRMSNGGIERTEWRDRNAVISGEWYVKRDDPAISRAEWHEYRR